MLRPHRSSGSIAGAASVTVAASCDTLWDVISGVDGAVGAVPGVVSVERLYGSEPGEFRVGSKWREIRDSADGRITVTVSVVRMTCGDKSVTDIAEAPESFPRSVSLAASYEKPYHGITSCSSLSVRPSGNRKGHSILEGTFAAAPVRFVDKIKWTLCCCCSKKNSVVQCHESDLDLIAAIAAQLEGNKSSEGAS